MPTERNVLFAYKTDDEIEAERLDDLKEWRKLAKKHLPSSQCTRTVLSFVSEYRTKHRNTLPHSSF